MSKNNSSFQDLEKQLAKDTLEKALKDLHGEIIKDINKNKAAFSQEIQKTMADFKANIEKSLSEELDKKISAHLQKNFSDISTKITTSFYESSSPLLKRAGEDLTRLHRQGEETLSSWKAMMLQYTNLWTKPFMIAFLASAFAGTVIFFFCTYLLWGKYTQEIQNYERRLASNENALSWYFEQHQEHTEALKKGNQLASAGAKNKAPGKKAKK